MANTATLAAKAQAVDEALDTLESAAAEFLTEVRALDKATRGTPAHRVRSEYTSAESRLNYAAERRMFRASHPDQEGRPDYRLSDQFPTE